MTGQDLIDFIVGAKAEKLDVCFFAQGKGPIVLTLDDLGSLKGNYIVPGQDGRNFGKYIGIGASEFLSHATPVEDDECEPTEVKPDPRMTMTFDEVVADILAAMTDVEVKTWLGVSENDLIMGHHTTGRAIRNTYGLWTPGNPIVGTDENKKHPDDVSMEIMKAVWNKVRAAKAYSDGRSIVMQ
jgi:hypothetical protein